MKKCIIGKCWYNHEGFCPDEYSKHCTARTEKDLKEYDEELNEKEQGGKT